MNLERKSCKTVFLGSHNIYNQKLTSKEIPVVQVLVQKPRVQSGFALNIYRRYSAVRLAIESSIRQNSLREVVAVHHEGRECHARHAHITVSIVGVLACRRFRLL